jgi:hypothetical protein
MCFVVSEEEAMYNRAINAFKPVTAQPLGSILEAKPLH